ncbi:MAG TPA: hypothetical protein VMV01_17035 [Planctomycetota bacterium]|nr:hypothetical protein [Planctomycetota bacterium]
MASLVVKSRRGERAGDYRAERAGELPRDRPLAVFCGGGTRSRIGISVLRRAGFTQLLDQGGGFPEHAEAGLPVE